MNTHYKTIILAIITGELLIFFGQIVLGVIVHIINLHAMIILMIFSKGDEIVGKQLIQSLLLLLQLRIINVAVPLFFTMTLYLYPLIYGPLFISIYILLRHQKFTLEEIGVTTKLSYVYLPVAIPIGLSLAWIEYHIINPSYPIPDLRVPNLIVLVIIMFAFVGLAEELIFRSILLTRLEQVLGAWKGLLIASILFGIMCSGYGIFYEVLFATLAGAVIGYIFQRTRSLPFIVTIHGAVNVFLFGLIPHLL